MDAKPETIDAYLAGVPDSARAALSEIRRVVRELEPEAVESISYDMPTFTYRGRPLLYFAAMKKHCALYGTAEGTIRFAPDEPPSPERLRALIETRRATIDANPGRAKRA